MLCRKNWISHCLLQSVFTFSITSELNNSSLVGVPSLMLQIREHEVQEAVMFSHFIEQDPPLIGLPLNFPQCPLPPYLKQEIHESKPLFIPGIDFLFLNTDFHIWITDGDQSDSSVILIRSDQISHSVVSNSLRPHESQHARPPCPSPTPGVHWDSSPLSQWCHPAISSSVTFRWMRRMVKPFSACPLLSLPLV